MLFLDKIDRDIRLGLIRLISVSNPSILFDYFSSPVLLVLPPLSDIKVWKLLRVFYYANIILDDCSRRKIKKEAMAKKGSRVFFAYGVDKTPEGRGNLLTDASVCCASWKKKDCRRRRLKTSMRRKD